MEKLLVVQSFFSGCADEQTADCWVNAPSNLALSTLSGHLQQNHDSRLKYYITKTRLNPNSPLARSSFDSTPFCVVEGNME
ncbi:lytic polysaccharide monooxygenase [Vibrio chagasii]|nr:lytic polysaccharide monooxygenase [Vibrio chagasii]